MERSEQRRPITGDELPKHKERIQNHISDVKEHIQRINLQVQHMMDTMRQQHQAQL